MRTRHATAAVLAAFVSVGLLAGCAVGTGGTADDAAADISYDADASLTGTLTVMGFSGVDEIATTRMDAAKKALGGVEVKLVKGELDIQQFLSAAASGKPPDLIYANRNQLGSLAARGAILPLDACYEGEGIDKGEYLPSAIGQLTLADHVYGVPEFAMVQVTMANGDLLDRAGVRIEDVNGSDPEAMREASKKLAGLAEDGKKLIGVDSKLPEFFPLWGKANGADLMSQDGRKAQLDSPEAIAALEWANAIYADQGGFSKVKAIRDAADFFGEGNQYATGVLGAMPMEQWYINVLNDMSPDAPLVFDTVQDRNGEPIAFSSGSAWAIPKGAENPQAACRWARVMTATDTWIAAAQARLDKRNQENKPFTGVLTGNVVADEKVRAMTTSGGAPWDDGVAAMYEANEHTFSLPANPADAEFEDIMQDAVNQVLTGEKDAAAALHAAQEQAQSALDDAWAKLDKEK